MSENGIFSTFGSGKGDIVLGADKCRYEGYYSLSFTTLFAPTGNKNKKCAFCTAILFTHF